MFITPECFHPEKSASAADNSSTQTLEKTAKTIKTVRTNPMPNIRERKVFMSLNRIKSAGNT